eukprot:SAG11_NODE_2893_length_2860_cov_8.281420_1_plen_65_part_00
MRAIPHGYSGKSRTYKNFEKLIPQNFACSRLGRTTVQKPMDKWYPYHFTIGFLPDVQGKKKHRY